MIFLFQMKCLSGLAKFHAIGTLDLSNNFITWEELSYLYHVHVLDLRLEGNAALDEVNTFCVQIVYESYF